MLVDPSADRPLYQQLANLIRTKIQTGEFAPRQHLPAQKDYEQEHRLSRHTVDRAMNVLRTGGLIITTRQGSRVRPSATRTTVLLGRGKISARLPTQPERQRHGINEGVPILLVTRDRHDKEETYPADQVEILTGLHQLNP